MLLTVALLLQGPVGAFEALRDYTLDLLGALLGGETLCREVLCQSAPLAIAVAAITFSYRCNWLRFSAPTSLVLASALLLLATWGGNSLRALTVGHQPASDAELTIMPASYRSGTRVLLSDRFPPTVDKRDVTPGDVITVSQAWAKLSDLQAPATDGSHHRWSDRVPRVALVPEVGAVVGLVARAINQILGYFVVYRPRLFLSAVLLGVYIGWSWQPYTESIRSWIGGAGPSPAAG